MVTGGSDGAVNIARLNKLGVLSILKILKILKILEILKILTILKILCYQYYKYCQYCVIKNVNRLSSGEKLGVLSQGPTIVYDVKMLGFKVDLEMQEL